MTSNLNDSAYFVNEKINIEELNNLNYISTENMLPDKGGVTKSSGLPNANYTQCFSEGDILLSNIRPYFKKIWYATFNGGCSNDVLVLRAKNNVCSKFLYYVLSDDKFFEYDTATSKGTKMPRGDKVAIMKYSVPQYDLPTQEKIAGVLSSLDDKIELNNKINQNLEQQAQAIFKSWFVDFEPFGGKMPDDWKVGNLYEIANVTMGQSPDGKSYNENGYGEVFYQGRAEFGSRYPTRRLYTTEPKRMANAGDILMSVRAPVGDINVALEKCCIGRGLASISSRDNFNSFILYTLMNLKRSFDIYNAEGTVFGAINKDSLNSIEVIIPTKEEIYKFEEIASNLDKKIRQNTIEVQKLQKIRDTLLPKLMSGEIDVDKI